MPRATQVQEIHFPEIPANAFEDMLSLWSNISILNEKQDDLLTSIETFLNWVEIRRVCRDE